MLKSSRGSCSSQGMESSLNNILARKESFLIRINTCKVGQLRPMIGVSLAWNLDNLKPISAWNRSKFLSSTNSHACTAGLKVLNMLTVVEVPWIPQGKRSPSSFTILCLSYSKVHCVFYHFLCGKGLS